MSRILHPLIFLLQSSLQVSPLSNTLKRHKQKSSGRALSIVVLDWMYVVTEVLFGSLNAGEDLLEESLVLGLLTVCHIRQK